MSKNIIQLTESELKQVISESVKKIIKEQYINALQAEYKKSLNAPYEHLLYKKVRVTYKTWFWNDKSDEERTDIGYWGGYYIEFGEFKPRFYQVKKDGTMSSRELHLYPKEFLSMEEVAE